MLFKDIGVIDENFNYISSTNLLVEDDIIKYIGKEMPREYTGKVISGKGRLIMPGFYNTHAHSPMTIMRGYGENLSLKDWLFTKIFPFENQLKGEDVYWSTMLAMAESLKFGIVSTTDMYYFIDEMVEAISKAGCKDNISRGVVNIEGKAFENLEAIQELTTLVKKYNGYSQGKIVVDASLHGEYTSNPETAKGLAKMAKDLGLRMHIHLSESEAEHLECKERHKMTPAEYMADCGIFDVPTTAAHCIYVEDEDMDIMREKGVTVATNPVSNLKLASGIANIPKLMEKNVKISIGTDGVASNNNLSFFEEMKTMSLLAKIKSMDPKVVTPKETLYMATRAGALAQGRDNCGLIKEGYKADLIVLKTDVPNMQPAYSMVNNIVLSATDSDIEMTVVDGKILYKNGQYTTIDIEKTIDQVNKSRDRIMKELG